jgi:hypothetical protein
MLKIFVVEEVPDVFHVGRMLDDRVSHLLIPPSRNEPDSEASRVRAAPLFASQDSALNVIVTMLGRGVTGPQESSSQVIRVSQQAPDEIVFSNA